MWNDDDCVVPDFVPVQCRPCSPLPASSRDTNCLDFSQRDIEISCQKLNSDNRSRGTKALPVREPKEVSLSCDQVNAKNRPDDKPKKATSPKLLPKDIVFSCDRVNAKNRPDDKPKKATSPKLLPKDMVFSCDRVNAKNEQVRRKKTKETSLVASCSLINQQFSSSPCPSPLQIKRDLDSSMDVIRKKSKLNSLDDNCRLQNCQLISQPQVDAKCFSRKKPIGRIEKPTEYFQPKNFFRETKSFSYPSSSSSRFVKNDRNPKKIEKFETTFDELINVSGFWIWFFFLSLLIAGLFILWWKTRKESPSDSKRATPPPPQIPEFKTTPSLPPNKLNDLNFAAQSFESDEITTDGVKEYSLTPFARKKNNDVSIQKRQKCVQKLERTLAGPLNLLSPEFAEKNLMDVLLWFSNEMKSCFENSADESGDRSGENAMTPPAMFYNEDVSGSMTANQCDDYDDDDDQDKNDDDDDSIGDSHINESFKQFMQRVVHEKKGVVNLTPKSVSGVEWSKVGSIIFAEFMNPLLQKNPEKLSKSAYLDIVYNRKSGFFKEGDGDFDRKINFVYEPMASMIMLDNNINFKTVIWRTPHGILFDRTASSSTSFSTSPSTSFSTSPSSSSFSTSPSTYFSTSPSTSSFSTSPSTYFSTSPSTSFTTPSPTTSPSTSFTTLPPATTTSSPSTSFTTSASTISAWKFERKLFRTKYIEVINQCRIYDNTNPDTHRDNFVGTWYDVCRGSGYFLPTKTCLMARNSVHLLNLLNISDFWFFKMAHPHFIRDLALFMKQERPSSIDRQKLARMLSSSVNAFLQMKVSWMGPCFGDECSDKSSASIGGNDRCGREDQVLVEAKNPLRLDRETHSEGRRFNSSVQFLVFQAAIRGFKTIQLLEEWDENTSSFRNYFCNIIDPVESNRQLSRRNWNSMGRMDCFTDVQNLFLNGFFDDNLQIPFVPNLGKTRPILQQCRQQNGILAVNGNFQGNRRECLKLIHLNSVQILPASTEPSIPKMTTTTLSNSVTSPSRMTTTTTTTTPITSIPCPCSNSSSSSEKANEIQREQEETERQCFLQQQEVCRTLHHDHNLSLRQEQNNQLRCRPDWHKFNERQQQQQPANINHDNCK